MLYKKATIYNFKWIQPISSTLNISHYKAMSYDVTNGRLRDKWILYVLSCYGYINIINTKYAFILGNNDSIHNTNATVTNY